MDVDAALQEMSRRYPLKCANPLRILTINKKTARLVQVNCWERKTKTAARKFNVEKLNNPRKAAAVLNKQKKVIAVLNKLTVKKYHPTNVCLKYKIRVLKKTIVA